MTVITSIPFDHVEAVIRERESLIRETKKGMSEFLIFDDKFRVVVDPDRKQEAMEFIAQTNELDRKNKADRLFIEKVRKIAEKNGLPLDRAGVRQQDKTIRYREVLDLDHLRQRAQGSIDNSKKALKEARYRDSITPEMEHERAEQIQKAESVLEAVSKAKSEIEKLEQYCFSD